jgi:hypothetical protein
MNKSNEIEHPEQSPKFEIPEPFNTVMELVAERGNREILEALAQNAEFDADDDSGFFCPKCREGFAYLHLELTQLLARYDWLYPELEEEEHEQPALHFYPTSAVSV